MVKMGDPDKLTRHVKQSLLAAACDCPRPTRAVQETRIIAEQRDSLAERQPGESAITARHSLQVPDVANGIGEDGTGLIEDPGGEEADICLDVCDQIVKAAGYLGLAVYELAEVRGIGFFRSERGQDAIAPARGQPAAIFQ